jgi:hypothetical protein
VNTNRGHARFGGQNTDDCGRLIAIGRLFTKRTEEPFARRANENRIAQRDELVEVAQKLPVVVSGLGEPEARINPQFSGGDTRGLRGIDSSA